MNYLTYCTILTSLAASTSILLSGCQTTVPTVDAPSTPESPVESAPAEKPVRGKTRTLKFPEDRSLGWLAQRHPSESDQAWLFGDFAPETAFAQAQGEVTLPDDVEVQLMLNAKEWHDLSPLAKLKKDALYRIIISDDLSANYAAAREQEQGPLLDGGRYLGKLTGLQSLVLNEDRIVGNELEFLSNLKQLKTLTVTSKALTNEGLVEVGKVQTLEGLRIHLEQGYSAEGLRQLSNLRDLEFLFISGTYQPDAFQELGRQTSLRRLTLNSFEEVPGGFAALGNLQNLTHLHFSHRVYSAADLAFLPKLANLESAGIRYVLNDSAKVYAAAGAGQLRQLLLMDLSEGASLRPIAAMPKLESLLLLRSSLNDHMIAELGSMPRLHEIALSPERFGGLPNITDRTLEALGQMKALETIRLPFGRFTDGGIKHLFGLKKLKRLEFTNITGFTDKAMDALVWMQSLEELELNAEPFSMAALNKLYDLPRLKKLTLHAANEEQTEFMNTFNATRQRRR